MSNARATKRPMDLRVKEVLHAYRSWASPKTAPQRMAAAEQRRRAEQANIAAKEDNRLLKMIRR